MNSFDLYIEAKNQYEKLIPNKNDGLILLSLYDKYKDKEFTEQNIISVIKKIFKDQGNESLRTENNRNNNIVLRLQESFLWRNNTKRTYRFKKYGLEWCQNIEKRLIKRYSPAKIKRFFDELYKSLSENIEEGKDFNQWIEDHFEIRMPELISQIEILDQQVNESVQDFQSNIKSQEKGILNVLKEIEFRLDIIKEQALKIKNAFQISYDIDELMTGILEGNSEYGHIENIKRVQDFHDNSRSQLEHISKRIEKIKPRIREFIYDFNRKDFDRKTGKFIDYLLNNSFVKRDRNTKRIYLPGNLSGIQIKSAEHNLKLNVISIRDISPKMPVEVTRRQVDVIKQKELIVKAKKWKQEKARVKYWTNVAFQELEEIGILVFSPFFFKILDKDKLKIAVKTTYSIIRRCTKLKHKYSIEIKREAFKSSSHKETSLWQMKIQKK